MKYDALEIARIIGQPLDPRKPYPQIVEMLCETDTAEPQEYVYYFDVLTETEKIYAINNGVVTTEEVSFDTPASLSFTDVATPEYKIILTDYASRKENALARKNLTINRALNSYETYTVIQLLSTAASASSQAVTLGSGYTRFSYPHVIDMLEYVQDYGDNYSLVIGANSWKDLKLWNWNDNKYHNLNQAWADLNIEMTRLSLAGSAQTFSYDDDNSGGVTSTDILGANSAYLVAKDTVMGKPMLFVRKKLDSVKELAGVMATDGDNPERLILVSPNPVTTSGTTGTRKLAIGVTGLEQIAAAVTNSQGVCSFTRS